MLFSPIIRYLAYPTPCALIRNVCLSLLFCIAVLSSLAQPGGNLRQKFKALSIDSIQIDTLSIIPGTLVVIDKHGKAVDPNSYSLSYASAQFLPSTELLEKTDSVWLTYRVFPILFAKDYYKRKYSDSLSPDSLLGRERPPLRAIDASSSPLGDGIQSSGSFTRGISFGNNQDLSVRSGMNIQLSGELGPNLFLEGAISDRDIPLQPQGNTARLQEFDRVYLKVYSSSFAVRAGDIELQEGTPHSPLRFYRNVQGLAYDVGLPNANKTDTLSIRLAVSVPKGKFARNTLQPANGNQGPYRLVGANNEPYIIVLSASERVYIDGVLVKRGEENQYTIDYNTAEISFTSLMPITQFSRITVEFEYSERSYARFTTYAMANAQKGKWIWNLAAYSEMDSRNQPFDQQLTDEQQQLLSSIGDNLNLAFAPQIDSVAFTTEIPLYEKIDTISGGVSYTVYRHSTNPLKAHFRLAFSNVGQGKGNYVPNFTSANGRTFRWVAPVAGKPQGSFEPVKRLVAPRKQQMITAGVGRKWNKNSEFNLTAALSNNDLNTFSDIDSDDDLGQAVMGSLVHNVSLSDSLKSLLLGGNFLFSSSGFRYVDRIRSVEFERDWANVMPLTGQSERYISLWTDYSKINRFNSQFRLEGLGAASSYAGGRASLTGWFNALGNKLSYSFAGLNASDSIAHRSFYRGKMQVSRKMKWLETGFLGEFEDLRMRDEVTSQFLPQSQMWQMGKAYISTPDTLAEKMMASYSFRRDFRFSESNPLPLGESQSIVLTAQSQRPRTGNLTLSFGLNQFTPKDTAVISKKREDSFLGRLDYTNQIKGNFWIFGGSYDLSSGLEPGNEYYFVEVPAGQGVYSWIDYNGNGVKELNEFEIANFPDEARYVRINFPGTLLVRVKTTTLNLRSSINPSVLLKNKKGLLGALSRLSNQTSFLINQKNRYENFNSYANPFAGSPNDTLITSSTQQFRNSFAINRGNRTWGAEYIYSDNANTQLQANGFEHRSTRNNRVTSWFEFYKGFTLTVEGSSWLTKSTSQFFGSKNFEVSSLGPLGSVKYAGDMDFTIEVGYDWRKAHRPNGEEQLVTQTLFVKTDFALLKHTMLIANFARVANSFRGQPNSSVAYEMLRGLQPGLNATWDLSVKQRLSKTLELEAGYNGRYLGNGKIIHTGSMQARALF
jgi:hypothetical protein